MIIIVGAGVPDSPHRKAMKIFGGDVEDTVPYIQRINWIGV